MRGTRALDAVRAHAVDLAHEQLTTEFRELADSDASPNDPDRKHRKDSLLVRLKKLQPGCTASLRALRKPDGTVTLEPRQMATELARYWGTVFQRREVDLSALPHW